jgi:hypothetical protein
MTPTYTGCKPRCCSAERKRSGCHEANDDARHSRPSSSFPRFSKNFSHPAIGYGHLESCSGGDLPRQGCSLVGCEFTTSSTCHEDTTSFRSQFGIGRVRSTIRPEESIYFKGKKSRFTLRGTLNCRGSHRHIRKSSQPAQHCAEDDSQRPNQQPVQTVPEFHLLRFG